ncbi:MAG: hypothetical protein JWM22_1055 [Frankiales bacterium]|jgi:hypothetical protein|nr:hypothetical protein [Frankiales bacterium]
MSRRIALPGADELFRSTGDSARPAAEEPSRPAALTVAPYAEPAAPSSPMPPPMRSAVPSPAAPADGTDDHEGLDEASSAVRSASRRRPRALADRRPSGRESHDEKITVYLSADELMDLEHARLALRGDHGLPVDRGRVVREALAVVLADFEAKGDASILVRRLRGR